MSKVDVIRAWKDPEYRRSLSARQQAALPANPIGGIELTDAELQAVDGGGTLDELAADLSITCPTPLACTPASSVCPGCSPVRRTLAFNTSDSVAQIQFRS